MDSRQGIANLPRVYLFVNCFVAYFETSTAGNYALSDAKNAYCSELNWRFRAVIFAALEGEELLRFRYAPSDKSVGSA